MLNWAIPLLVVAGAALILVFCCRGIGTSGGPTNQAATTGNVPGTQPSHAPDFTLSLLNGHTFQLASAAGHPVVLYFMAPTCATCAWASSVDGATSLLVR